MDGNERRENPRVPIYDPVTYQNLSPDGEILQQNVAIVRNVSKTGIRIETFEAIRSKIITLMFYDLNKIKVEVMGEVIYCDRNDCGQYNVGINLASTAFENRLFVKALVKSYHYQKNNTYLIVSPSIQN